MILRLARALMRDRSGSAAEFALTLPVWIIIIFAVLNTGRFFVARAGIQNGLGEAARVATLWPAKDQATMRAAFNAGTFGLSSSEAPDLDFATGTANGQAYVDLTVTYDPQFFLMFIPVSPVTLTYTRRAFRPA
jgi:Flp pilus assembly protein TadG